LQVEAPLPNENRSSIPDCKTNRLDVRPPAAPLSVVQALAPSCRKKRTRKLEREKRAAKAAPTSCPYELGLHRLKNFRVGTSNHGRSCTTIRDYCRGAAPAAPVARRQRSACTKLRQPIWPRRFAFESRQTLCQHLLMIRTRERTRTSSQLR